MKKILITLTLLIVCCAFIQPATRASEGYVNYDDLLQMGFSKYFAKLTMDQRSRMHDTFDTTQPSKMECFWKHIIWGDYDLPTQSFGYYDIGGRD